MFFICWAPSNVSSVIMSYIVFDASRKPFSTYKTKYLQLFKLDLLLGWDLLWTSIVPTMEISKTLCVRDARAPFWIDLIFYLRFAIFPQLDFRCHACHDLVSSSPLLQCLVPTEKLQKSPQIIIAWTIDLATSTVFCPHLALSQGVIYIVFFAVICTNA